MVRKEETEIAGRKQQKERVMERDIYPSLELVLGARSRSIMEASLARISFTRLISPIHCVLLLLLSFTRLISTH